MGNYRNRISVDVLGSLDLLYHTRKRNRKEKKNNLFEKENIKVQSRKGKKKERKEHVMMLLLSIRLKADTNQPLWLKLLPLPLCIGLPYS